MEAIAISLRPSLVAWRPSLIILEAIASSLEDRLVGWSPLRCVEVPKGFAQQVAKAGVFLCSRADFAPRRTAGLLGSWADRASHRVRRLRLFQIKID